MNRLPQTAQPMIVNGAIPTRPSLARIYLVAADLDDWTAEERAWIAEHPELLEYKNRLANAIATTQKDKSTQLTPAKAYADAAFHV